MRLILTTILLSLTLPLLSIFILEEIHFDSEFDEIGSREQLLNATQLSLNTEVTIEQIQASTQHLLDYCQSQGMYFAQIPSPQIVPIQVNRIGLYYSLIKLVDSQSISFRFAGNRYFTEAKLRELLLLSDDLKLNLEQINALLAKLVVLYNDRSYFFAEASLDSLILSDQEPRQLNAVIKIDEGPLFRLQEILCTGNLYTRNNALIKISGLRQMNRINPQSLLEAAQRIQERNYVEDCEIIPVDANRLLIRIREGKMTHLEGVAGYNQIGDKSELSGLINLRFYNLWGSDRALNLYWRNLPSGSNQLELSYHESGLNSFPVAADLKLARTSQDSTWIKSGLATDLYYYHQQHRLGLEFLFETISPGSRRPMLIERNSNRSMGFFWKFSKLDNRINPSRGNSSELRYRFYLGVEEDEPESAFEANSASFVPLTNRWVTALNINLRSLDRYINNELYLYRMGGFKTLRGYREDTISAWALAWINAELRYRLSTDSRIYLFYDQGLQMQNQTQANFRLFSFGLGLSYKTRLGNLRVDYALGYKDKDMWDLGLGIIHLGLDASF